MWMHMYAFALLPSVCVSFYRTDWITTFDVILMVFRYGMLSQRACLFGFFFFVKMWIEWVRSSYLFYFLNICASLNGSIYLCFIRFKACYDKSQTWCIYCLHVESISADRLVMATPGVCLSSEHLPWSVLCYLQATNFRDTKGPWNSNILCIIHL